MCIIRENEIKFSCLWIKHDESEVAQLCPILCHSMDCSPPRLLCPRGNSSGKNTGVGCYFLLQGIFPTQEWNTGLPHCRQTLPSEPPGKRDSGAIY